MQSSRKQKERSCTGQLHGPCKRETVSTGLQHGACPWGVQLSSSAHGACCSTRTVFIFRLARVSEVLHGVRFLAQHRACRLARVTLVLHGSSLVLHGSCNFSSSEVGNLIFFSIFRVYYDLRILIGLIKDPMNEIGWVEDLIVNPDNPNWELDWKLWNWEAGNLIDSLDSFNSVY